MFLKPTFSRTSARSKRTENLSQMYVYSATGFAPPLKPESGLIQVTLPTEQENLMNPQCIAFIVLTVPFVHRPDRRVQK